MAAPAWSDERVEHAVATLLRVGVALAALLIAAGGALHLHRHGAEPPHYHVFAGEPAQLRTVAGIVHGATQGDALALIQLGLLALIATPIARVALSLAAFALQRDATYVVVTAIVLLLLILSVTGLVG
jgi:uncharacterized membrane protein